jgi:serine/threonine protein kinase
MTPAKRPARAPSPRKPAPVRAPIRQQPGPAALEEIREFEYRTGCRILRKLAEGGMGSVYFGEQLGAAGFAKLVAIKVIRPERLSNSVALQMFLDEAKLVADLVHTNIVQVHNLGISGNLYFVVMEYVHGKTLSDYMQTCMNYGCLPPPDFSAFIVSRICRGLAYAHTKRDRHGQPLGIVHRDVTPSNIMMDFRGAVKLADFGIAKALTMHMLDETHTVMGKFNYMAPEQATMQGTDARTDLFSLGLVLYELLTGVRVFNVSSPAALIAQMQTQAIADPRKHVRLLPAELADICLQAVQLDPAHRFQTAEEFGDAIERYMYSSGYGPTNEKMAKHLLELWPDADRDIIR